MNSRPDSMHEYTQCQFRHANLVTLSTVSQVWVGGDYPGLSPPSLRSVLQEAPSICRRETKARLDGEQPVAIAEDDISEPAVPYAHDLMRLTPKAILQLLRPASRFLTAVPQHRHPQCLFHCGCLGEVSIKPLQSCSIER